VVAHEVAHLVELNHSPDFWAIVSQLRPGYKKPQKWLRSNGLSLHRYG
jgi:predicted metal-dependent hydrolase